MKKTVFPKKNSFNATGLIVANDAAVNAAGTVAHFRMAVSGSSKDKPSVFFDCVMFGKADRPIPVSMLKRGSKIEVTGYFQMNVIPARGEFEEKQKLELVVTSVSENVAVEIDVEDDGAARAAAPAPAPVAVPVGGPDIPEELLMGMGMGESGINPFPDEL